MQQLSQTKRIILFVVLMLAAVGIWFGLRWYFPPPAPTAPAEVWEAAAAFSSSDGGLGQGLGQAALLAQAEGKGPEENPPAEAKKPVPEPVKQAAAAWAPGDGGWGQFLAQTGLAAQAEGRPPAGSRPPTAAAKLKTLGEKDRNSPYHLYVVLDPRGASVRLVLLNKFQQADSFGRPVTEPDGSPTPLTLVPDDSENPSCQLLHFPANDKDADKPFDTLGKVDWTVAEDQGAEAAADGPKPQSWTFVSPPVQGYQITKKYTLAPGQYHLGLDVTVQRVENDPTGKAASFRYQMTGFHGLPVEGRWYTNYFRNSLIGKVEKDKPHFSRDVNRVYQDLRQVSVRDGGDAVNADEQPTYLIRYAGVAVQYFASVIVVDDKQNEGQKDDFIAQARPTLERAVARGTVTKVTRGDDPRAETTFELKRSDRNDSDPDANMTFRIRKEDEAKFDSLQVNASAAVIYTTGSYQNGEYPEYARELRNKDETQPLWEDDVTVRVATKPVELKSGESFTHRYLLYNGPVKVMLLDQADTAAEKVAPGLVSRYIDDLNLNTMTDAPSPSPWIGSITGPTGIAWLLIQITNIMHWVLWFLHAYLYIPYILCIVCLTVMVRGIMFPISRKQAMTSLRMQQLAPELKKLQEKFKDDKQGMAAAQMELYRKHGVNPFGTCWLLLLQMPIFMGLYYSLQESIHFRLAGLSSWWLPNLAAPDMLVNWNYYFTVPIIGDPSWYGYLWFLGPYLNILPIVAVSLMLVQQKWTMPPPTDEQQEQQQKMMKYMMVFMGLMFYKVASGLCIYFIASSLWGFMERKLLPKKKLGTAGAATPADDDSSKGNILSRLLAPRAGNGSGVTTAPSTAVASGKSKRGKRRQESRPRGKDDGDGSMFQRLRDWWEDILEQARKK